MASVAMEVENSGKCLEIVGEDDAGEPFVVLVGDSK